MSDRQQSKYEFLKKNNLESNPIIDFVADASFRRYSRIQTEQTSLILMDAPPEKEPIISFIKIAKLLKNNGINAPQIFEYDIENGFILLEDFGDESFRKYLITNPSEETKLYQASLDIIRKLSIATDELEIYSWEKLLQELSIFFDYYLKNVTRSEQHFLQAQDYLIQSFKEAYNSLNDLGKYVVMRDYHADNLHWLASQIGDSQVGVLDFQDAVMGCYSYDLVSLLQDARRDLLIKEQFYLKYFLDQNSHSGEKFLNNYYFFSLQRNLKIIGFIYRKKFRDSNDNYLHLAPRVWNYIHQVINESFSFSPLSKAINKYGECFKEP